MKFTTPLLTLLFTSSVLSYSIPTKREESNDQNDNTIISKDIDVGSILGEDVDLSNFDFSNFDPSDLSNVDLSFIGIKKNEECDKAIEEYKDCLVGTDKIESSNKDNVCNTFNSEKCQSFFKNDIKKIKGCENLDELLYKIKKFVSEVNDASLKMQCAKDENGKYCPLSDLSSNVITNYSSGAQEDIDEETKKLYIQAVNDTCKSRTCINAALEFETNYNNINKEIVEFKDQIETVVNFLGAVQDMPMSNPGSKFRRAFNVTNFNDETLVKETADYLRTEECSIQAPKAESSATSLKYTSALIMTVILMLFHLA